MLSLSKHEKPPSPFDKLRVRALRSRHMRIATWNINSVRMRAVHLERLDELAAPDVVCLQETKVLE